MDIKKQPSEPPWWRPCLLQIIDADDDDNIMYGTI
jgi:hypothetical protein